MAFPYNGRIVGCEEVKLASIDGEEKTMYKHYVQSVDEFIKWGSPVYVIWSSVARQFGTLCLFYRKGEKFHFWRGINP